MVSNRDRFHLLFCVFLCASSSYIHVVSAANRSFTYTPAENILINCGARGTMLDDNGRTWDGDDGSKFAPWLQNTLTDTVSSQAFVSQVPFTTARFFTSNHTYSFPVSPGRKFVRLYFYPTNYTSHTDSLARFSVTSGEITLFRNFRTSQIAQALNYNYLTREFSINVSSSVLNLTFVPSSNLFNSYAFINGIEIVSMPGIFASAQPNIVGTSIIEPIDPSVALATEYRLNVGGNTISPVQDSGLFREWLDDSPYIYGAATGVSYSIDANVSIKYPTSIPHFIAPDSVYGTARSMGPSASINLSYNLTWILPVDPGFYYLVRLHFCEILFPITRPNQRVFDIFINNQTAFRAADVIGWSHGIGIPYYEDFVAIIPDGCSRHDMWVALHPNVQLKPQYYDALLNGLEIFKLSRHDGNLAGLDPFPQSEDTVDRSNVLRPANQRSTIPVILGELVGGVVIVFFSSLLLITHCQRRSKGGSKRYGTNKAHWLPLTLHRNSHLAGSAKTTTNVTSRT